AKTPTIDDGQLVSAIYLITVGRVPTAAELKKAQEQFAESHSRVGVTLRLAMSLVRSKEFRADLADANMRILKAQQELAKEVGIAKALHKLNSDEFQKLMSDAAASTSKAVNTDERVMDLAFLLTLSRFPTDAQVKQGIGSLQ